MRKTKIVCTLGPASESEEILSGMIKAGMNVARINMSHGNEAEHTKRINLVRKVSEKLKAPIAILIDTKGPEVRIRDFEGGSAQLTPGSEFTFTSRKVVGNSSVVSVTYENLARDLNVGDTILLNDGLLVFQVKSINGGDILTDVIRGGKVYDKKSMNFPGHTLNFDYMSDRDKEDLLFAIKMNVDYVAASFVSNAENVKDVRTFLLENGGHHINIISKIENADGVNNIDDIINASDGIMVARGDMGVEIPFAKLPAIQKMLIKKTRIIGKRVITATEMLESMIENPRPTRAEASDVANAVFDGSSAVMLSGETAMGKYPVEVVSAMSDIAEEAENNINFSKRFKELDVEIRNTADAISRATCVVADGLNAKLIIVFTKSGLTARMVSRFRPNIPIIAATFDKRAYTQLALNWGVRPIITKKYNSTDDLFDLADEIAKVYGNCKSGDTVLVTAGMPIGQGEGTNILKVIKVK